MFKLNYFNGRGLAEISRLLFAVADVSYEDYRYPLQINDWKTFDMVREEFDEDKKNGKLEVSLGKVPFLEVTENDEHHVICQSKAIERYIARKFNLMGTTELESAKVDAVCECIRDFKTAYQPVRKEENKDEAMKKWFSETLPEFLCKLEKILGDTYCVGSSLSLADITLYSFLVDFFDDKESVVHSYEECPKIKNIINLVSTNEKIQKWMESRPETSF